MGTPYLWTFSLGNVTLTRFEVPETFDIGHEVKEAVHQYVSDNGTPSIVVHSQGAFPIPTSWDGKLFGASAISRMQQIDALAVAELPVTWVYGPLSYIVHIKSFKASVKYQTEVDYKIEVTVISDQNGTVPPIDNGQSFDSGTQTFYDSATTAVMAIADPNLPDSVIAANSAMQSAFAAASPLKSATFSTITNLLSKLSTLISVLTPYVSGLQSTAVLYQDLVNLNNSLIALQGFGLLHNNLLQLVGQNFASATSVLLGAGQSLFGVAAQYYPNSDAASIAQLIATANGLDDFFVDAPTMIILPPVFS